jgi:hypothetical protein
MTLTVAALAGAGPTAAEAVVVSEAYLFSTFSLPVVTPATPATPPFTFTGTGATGFELTLNGSGIVTGVGSTGDVTRPISTPLTFFGYSGTINAGESGGTTAAHVNGEVGKLDDVGAVADGSSDAVLNLDFGDDAKVKFTVPVSGITHLLVAEDAGWDRFKLQYCATAACSSPTTLINWTGTSSGAVSSILHSSTDFQTDDDAPEIDQAWLFIFDAPLTSGYLRFTETENGSSHARSDGVRLEIDFVGGGVYSVVSSPVPEPGTLGLLAVGLAALGLSPLRGRRARRRRPAGAAGGPRPRAGRGA